MSQELKCGYCQKEYPSELIINGLCPSCSPLMKKNYNHMKAMKKLESELSYEDNPDGTVPYQPRERFPNE